MELVMQLLNWQWSHHQDKLTAMSSRLPPSQQIPNLLSKLWRQKGHSETHGDVYEGVKDANYTCSLVLADAWVTTPEIEVPFWENKHNEQPRVPIREEKKEL